MKRAWYILLSTTLMVLSALSCSRIPLTDYQLMVSLYIPGSVMTRAETGPVNPLEEELKITSLQIWVFISDEGGPMDGTFVTYKRFDSDLPNTGIPNSTITRFGLPLREEMFNLLSSSSRPKVDVYAVANASSAVTNVPQEDASRDALDQLVVNNIGGNWPFTESVPEAGLPMSGVLKGVFVTGGYPVLNISTLKLTRAVSKIRFVFSQQGVPATDTDPAKIANDACEIVSISFDGTNNGKDCQISTTERLFTEKAFDLGDEPGYVALSATINGKDGDPLIPNGKLSVLEDPESLFFRDPANESETAEHYEKRLDAAVSAESQVGPIYLRETDKSISGKIHYRTKPDGDEQTAQFSLDAGAFSRNHTWIVYACFVEETMKLRLKVVVLPWEWESYVLDYTTSSVNVIRRFTVFDNPTPTFYKNEADGFYDIRFWHTVEGVEGDNVVKGEIIIATPVGGKIYAKAVPGPGLITDAIKVTPEFATIYPNYVDMSTGRMEDCQIRFTIFCNRTYLDKDLEGLYMDLHFCVETPIDHQFVDLGSESIDYYRFILDSHWEDYLSDD